MAHARISSLHFQCVQVPVVTQAGHHVIEGVCELSKLVISRNVHS